ncbi:ZIP family metal transporter [Flagellimonas allohymeniacidonis]|uniref:ZIP family metal transporter n=1 Tax=Flagellimonas allohymeniacidonis TaxID=2517819 RepID=A0A4Q8QIJ3_9FLAO|nr:ZIP family metal transporter [Allomuricauda hymeniacidonis]TAI48239.1 ZIP family metal transporter [Allomuricauda hymeniacidonis]
MIFILPVISVWVGYIVAIFLKPKSPKGIQLLLAFSGAFLLALTFFELLPEVYESENSKEIAVYILVGILLQIFLEFFSKGAEHGHTHIQVKKSNFPIILFISLSLHALVEGVPIEEGNSILYGIIIHKLPVAIILSTFLINSKIKPVNTLIFIAAFSLITPLGTYLATQTNLIASFGSQITAIAIGVFLHVSTIILFESSKDHSLDFKKLGVIMVGVVLAYFL